MKQCLLRGIKLITCSRRGRK